MNYDMKIILSFFRLFHTFFSTLLVLEKERECYTIEYLVQLSNFFQLKCTFSKPLKYLNTAIFSNRGMANIEDCLIQTLLPKIGSFPRFEVIHSEVPWYCEHMEKEKRDLLESSAIQMKWNILFCGHA